MSGTSDRLPHAVHLPRGNLETKVEALIDRDRTRRDLLRARKPVGARGADDEADGYDNVASMSRGFLGWGDINGEIEG